MKKGIAENLTKNMKSAHRIAKHNKNNDALKCFFALLIPIVPV